MEQTESLKAEPDSHFIIRFTENSQILKVSHKIVDFSSLLANHQESTGKQLRFSAKNIDTASFQLIISLLETHNFEGSQFSFQKPLKSTNLSQCIDAKSYELLSPICNDNVAMLNLLKGCDYLDIELIKNLVYCCMMTSGKMFLEPTAQSNIYFGGRQSSEVKTSIKQQFKGVFEEVSVAILSKSRSRRPDNAFGSKSRN